MKNALIYTVVFAAIQMVVSLLVQAVWSQVTGKDMTSDPTGLIVTMAVFKIGRAHV